jgi:hypothetical protein
VDDLTEIKMNLEIVLIYHDHSKLDDREEKTTPFHQKGRDKTIWTPTQRWRPSVEDANGRKSKYSK